MYSEDCWGFRVSNFIWLSRVSRPLLYSYIITTLITHPLMFPPINLNNNLQPSSATSPKPSWILSSNHHQYCPPTIINIVLQPPSILCGSRLIPCLPSEVYLRMQLRDLVSEYQYYLISTKPREHFIKKKPENQSCNSKKTKEKIRWTWRKTMVRRKKVKRKSEQRSLTS